MSKTKAKPRLTLIEVLSVVENIAEFTLKIAGLVLIIKLIIS